MITRFAKIGLASALRTAAAASLLLVSGCGPLISFGDDGPADEVYGLRFDGAYSQPEEDAALIYVEQPLMGDGLGGQNISVVLENGRRSLLQGVSWSGDSADLIRAYMVRSLSAGRGVDFIGDGGLDVKANCYLGLNIWQFEFVPGAVKADDEVHVAIEFSLVRYLDSALIGRPTYQVQESVQGNGAEAVVLAFRRAMQTIGQSSRNWVAERGGECRG